MCLDYLLEMGWGGMICCVVNMIDWVLMTPWVLMIVRVVMIVCIMMIGWVMMNGRVMMIGCWIAWLESRRNTVRRRWWNKRTETSWGKERAREQD